jgi:thiol-disulfide isomerase/thioredoxin
MWKACVLFVAVLAAAFPPAAGAAKRAPNLEFKDLAGSTQSLANLRGSITVINFWATWCVPCREELPLLSSLSQRYAATKIRFIAVSADESADTSKGRTKIDAFLKTQNLGMDVWLGADLDTLDRLGLGNELPATAILDDQGVIVARILGEAREPDVTAPLDWLLNGRQGPAPAAVTKHL